MVMSNLQPEALSALVSYKHSGSSSVSFSDDLSEDTTIESEEEAAKSLLRKRKGADESNADQLTLPNTDVQIAPLDTPPHRRLETLMVFWHSISIPLFLSFFLFVITISPIVWMVLLPYIFYFCTDRSYDNGNVVRRRSEWFRDLPVWKLFVNYFPIKLIKTCELPPSFKEVIISDEYYIDFPLLAILAYLSGKKRIQIFKKKPYKTLKPTGVKYVFGYHPHGVVAMGAMGAIGTNGANWSGIFPNIPCSVLTLETQFAVPFYRDYLMALGISSVSKRNIKLVLAADQSVCIVIGGARESLLVKPNARKLVLKDRKGFIKIALSQKNVKLVPVFAFGENEIYDVLQPAKNSLLKKCQLFLKKISGFTIPLFHARGIFNYDFGLLPYRRPINVAVGTPIDIPYLESPTQEDIDKYHDIYVNGLLKLYNDNRKKFGYSSKLELV